MKEGQVIGIEAELVENGGVKTPDMKLIIHRTTAQLIGSPHWYTPQKKTILSTIVLQFTDWAGISPHKNAI
jgi:hypothetical protein